MPRPLTLMLTLSFLLLGWCEPRNGPENQVVFSRKGSSSYSTDMKGSEWCCLGPAHSSSARLRAGAAEGKSKPEAAPEKVLRQARGKSPGRAKKADEIMDVSGQGGSSLYKRPQRTLEHIEWSQIASCHGRASLRVIAPDPQTTPLNMTANLLSAQLQFSKDGREYCKQKCCAVIVTVCKHSPIQILVICFMVK